MPLYCFGHRRILLALASLTFLSASCLSADAKSRYALVVGVGDYKGSNGLNTLVTPSNDADEMRIALEHPSIGFMVDVLKDGDVPDKAAFDAALTRFVSRISQGDEVLIYFSGHGYNVSERPGAATDVKGNYYLLPDAKSQPAYNLYLKKQKPLEARELDTLDKQAQGYDQWIASIAPSEASIESAIAAKKPGAIVFIADANRTLVSGTQDAAIVGGLVAPATSASSVFKIYSATRGQSSVERPEEIKARKRAESNRRDKSDKETEKDKKAKAETRRLNSLFTRVLVRELQTPRLDIALLYSKVRMLVREQARLVEVVQNPAFSRDAGETHFQFWDGNDSEDIAFRCANTKNEMTNINYGVTSGVYSRLELERKRVELAPCGRAAEVGSYIKLQQQGAGKAERPGQSAGASVDPRTQCDELAASRFDKTRPDNFAGREIQNVALGGLESETGKVQAMQAIKDAIAACETAAQNNPRVVRYKFNLARANYALSILQSGLDRSATLTQASKLSSDAARQGHAAAYHMLAMLHLNGEFVDGGPASVSDRTQAWELLQRGADLNHVLALYELALAYRDGDIDADTDIVKEVKSDAKAYQFFSKAAEQDFIPAVIETAMALKSGYGVPRDTARAIELLRHAAARGSPEAMFRLAEIYAEGGRETENNKVAVDTSEATIWYARAAEYGDVRAQERLADRLSKGEGLPAQQPETAARYWRLAADGGSVVAQMQLANLLRDGKVPFRPRIDGDADGGAEEIRNLYAMAFSRGYPLAGLELARLYRKGFPTGLGSTAIPRKPELAVKLLWETMIQLRRMPEDSLAANPLFTFSVAKELIEIYDAGEAKTGDRTKGTEVSVITEDQIAQLRGQYGDPKRQFWILASALGKVQCGLGANFTEDVDNLWVPIWDSNQPESPTEDFFDWYENVRGCKQQFSQSSEKNALELGVSKKIRDEINKQYSETLKEREKKPDGYKKFTDRMADLMAKKSKRN